MEKTVVDLTNNTFQTFIFFSVYRQKKFFLFFLACTFSQISVYVHTESCIISFKSQQPDDFHLGWQVKEIKLIQEKEKHKILVFYARDLKPHLLMSYSLKK